jgi:hypothetical protein
VLAKSGGDGRPRLRGRVELGIGAGWHAGEHRAYCAGRYYEARDLDALPKPVQSPLPLLLGQRVAPAPQGTRSD